jgi:hypothetical protein
MAKTLDEVRRDAMELSDEDRDVLAQELRDSCMTTEERDVEAAWIEEAERRYADWQAGNAEAVSLDETLGELRAKYGTRERAAR